MRSGKWLVWPSSVEEEATAKTSESLLHFSAIGIHRPKHINNTVLFSASFQFSHSLHRVYEVPSAAHTRARTHVQSNRSNVICGIANAVLLPPRTDMILTCVLFFLLFCSICSALVCLASISSYAQFARFNRIDRVMDDFSICAEKIYCDCSFFHHWYSFSPTIIIYFRLHAAR